MRLIRTFILIAFVGINYAQAQYNIQFEVEGLQHGDTCILAHYYADQNKIVDSSVVNANGKVIFAGDKNLSNGVYIIVLPKKTYIEFVVPNDDQEFEIAFDTSLSPLKKSVTGSTENTVFFDFDKYAIGPGQKKRELIAEFKAAESPEQKQELREAIHKIDEDVDAQRKLVVKNNPNTFSAKLFNAVIDIEIPENLKNDTTGKRYTYFKNHYWDNIDLSDDGMIRTPIFKSKLEYFIGKVIQPDTLILAIDALVDRIEKAGAMELYKYVVWWNTNHHEESKLMCMDKVLHHMAKKYYCAGKCYWADSSLVAKMCEHAEKIGPSLCGNLAPDMTLEDTTFIRKFQLHKINSPVTIIVIWSHSCGHCKKDIPKLKAMYDSMHQRGVEVYAIHNNSEWKEWKAFIIKHKLNWLNVMDASATATYRKDYNIQTTPQVFMLDHNKVIRYKNPPAENVGLIADMMLKQYQEEMEELKSGKK